MTLEKGGGEKVEREGKPTGDPMNSKNRGAPVCEDCAEVVDDEVESGDECDIELDDTETNNDANKDAKRKAKLEEKIADDVAVDLALATGEQFTLLRRELMERYRKEEAEREVTTCTVAETKVPDAISQAGLEGSFPGGGFTPLKQHTMPRLPRPQLQRRRSRSPSRRSALKPRFCNVKAEVSPGRASSRAW